MKPFTRAGLAVSAAVLAAPIASAITFVCATHFIGTSGDGQTGIGPVVCAVYVGLVAAVLTAFFVVWGTSPRRTK